jgi:hypothetical protein
MDEPTPDDVRRSVTVVADALRGSTDADWSVAAGELEWSCRRTLIHTINAMLWYSANLATQSAEDDGDLPWDAPDSPIVDLVRGLEWAGFILARVAEASPPGARGYHGEGMADVSGFLAMACDETLIHGADVAAGLGLPFDPPRDVCDRTVGRLFPWAPEHDDPWERLQWCNGRLPLPDHPRLAHGWGWQCAPLDEWDGVARTSGSSMT